MKKSHGIISLIVFSFFCFSTSVFADGNSQGRAEKRKEANILMNGKPDYRKYEARVLEVIDGDTLKLEIYLWPGHVLITNVRVQGVDAPETRKQYYKCKQEKKLGLAAKKSIERKFLGKWVFVNNVKFDKYGGRVSANIDRWISDRFQSVKEELLDRKGYWGVEWEVGDPKHDWYAH